MPHTLSYVEINDLSYSVARSFLKKHHLYTLDNRLFANFKGELDAVEVLRAIWLEQMQGSPKKLIDFYEKIYNKEKKVHYENLIDTILIEFAIAFFSTVAGGVVVEEYSKKRDAIAKFVKKNYSRCKKEVCNLIRKFKKPLKYLFRVYVAKQYCENKLLPFETFNSIRKEIRIEVYSKKDNSSLPEEFKEFESRVIEECKLPKIDEDYARAISDDFLNILLEYDAKAKVANPPQQQRPLLPIGISLDSLVNMVEGLATHGGYAAGRVTVVISDEDESRVKEGDIMVLVQLNPDLVPAAKRAGALIGDEGGHTSHTAIVGRELNKPTIVNTQVGTKVLKDGMLVFVDATQGIVFEIT